MADICEAPEFITVALSLRTTGMCFDVLNQEVSTPEHMQAIAEVVWSLCQE